MGLEVSRANSLGLWKLTKGRVRAHTHDISALQVPLDSSRLLLELLGRKGPFVRPLQGRDRPRSRKCQRNDSCKDHTPGNSVSLQMLLVKQILIKKTESNKKVCCCTNKGLKKTLEKTGYEGIIYDLHRGRC